MVTRNKIIEETSELFFYLQPHQGFEFDDEDLDTSIPDIVDSMMPYFKIGNLKNMDIEDIKKINFLLKEIWTIIENSDNAFDANGLNHKVPF